VDEILLFNKFFSDCRYVPELRRYSPTKLCDGVEMAIFCTKATPCVEVWLLDVQSAMAEIRRGKKEDRKKKEETGQK